jgi:hypothetical protein
MLQRSLPIVLAVAVVGLGVFAVSQQRRLTQVEEALEALRSQSPAAREVTVVRSRAPAAPREGAAGAPVAAAPARPRVAVAEDEQARIESAVLNLLDGDHPELRAKLQSVVQEQQQNMQQREREERRERWIARREARLLQLGLAPEQREAVLTVMLANRDQIEDLRRDARTPEAIGEVRDRIRALRDQAEEQIRKQLTPEQYEAFRGQMDSDDVERAPPRPTL